MTFGEIFALTRTNAQGKPALGFGVIVLIMVLLVAGGLYLLHVIHLPGKRDPAVRVNTPNSGETRRGVGAPVEQPLLYKDELPDPRPRPTKSLEAAFQQNENAKAEVRPEEKRPLQGWVPRVDPSQMAASNPPALAKPTVSLSEQESLKYHFVETLLAITNREESLPLKKTGFQTRHFLPRGHKIPIILLSQINTSVGSMPVEIAVAQDVLFNGGIQLPFGWKIYGNASQGPNNKVNVQVNTIVDPAGRESPIVGMALNLDREPGFTGYPLESPFLLQMLPLAHASVKTFLDAAKNVTDQQSLVPSGAGNIVASQQQYSLDAKNKLLDASSKVLEGIMGKKSEELMKLYPEGTVVPRGTLGWIYLTSPLDLTTGEAGGSTKFLSAKDAAPAPNVITLGQQQESLRNSYAQPRWPQPNAPAGNEEPNQEVVQTPKAAPSAATPLSTTPATTKGLE